MVVAVVRIAVRGIVAAKAKTLLAGFSG